MSNIAFRWADPDDRQRIFEILTRAFHHLRGSSKWKQASQHIEAGFASYRVLAKDGEVIGIGHLSRHPLRIGRCLIDMGYIGQVAVLPELQDQGFGTLLVGNLLDTMRAEGYDLARLGGLVRYYRRFGWIPFPRRFVEFPLQKMHAGTAEVAVSDMLEPDPQQAQFVREYRAGTDRTRRDALVRQFNHQRTGSSQAPRRAQSGPFPRHQPRRWHLVYERDQKLLGYCSMQLFSEDISDFEASVNLREAAFDLACPDAVITLLKQVLWTAHLRGARRVTARLPWDPKIFAILRDAGLVFERVELLNPVTGNMLRLIDLRGLLTKIVPELSVRWRESGAAESGEFAIVVDQPLAPADSEQADAGGPSLVSSTTCVLRLGVERVELLADDSSIAPRWSAKLHPFEFLSLLLGLAPVQSVVANPQTSVENVRILDALFPVQPTASSTWG